MGIFDVRLSLHPDVFQMVRVNIARSEEEAKRAHQKHEQKAEKVAEVVETPAEEPKAE